jgi:hypothetical protein
MFMRSLSFSHKEAQKDTKKARRPTGSKWRSLPRHHIGGTGGRDRPQAFVLGSATVNPQQTQTIARAVGGGGNDLV